MKLQECFKSADGSELMNSPIRFEIISLRGQKTEDRGYGEKFDVVLKRITDEAEVHAELSEEQIQRRFRKVFKDQVQWEAKDGDIVDITWCSPSKPGGFKFYKAEPAVGDMQPQVPPPQVLPKDINLEMLAPSGDKWGGTPRQASFRAQTVEVMCAVMQSLGDDITITKERILSLTADYLIEARKLADELEATYPKH